MGGEVTEIVGHSCSGKSQFSLHLSLETAKASHDVFLFETNCSYHSQQLARILRAKGFESDEEAILSRIHVYRVLEMRRFLCLINKLIHELDKLNSSYSNLKMIVIDSLIFLFVDSLNLRNDPKRKYEAWFILKSLIQSFKTIFQKRPDIAVVAVNFRPNRLGNLWKNFCKVSLEFTALTKNLGFQVNVAEGGRIYHHEACRLLLTSEGFIDY